MKQILPLKKNDVVDSTRRLQNAREELSLRWQGEEFSWIEEMMRNVVVVVVVGEAEKADDSTNRVEHLCS